MKEKQNLGVYWCRMDGLQQQSGPKVGLVVTVTRFSVKSRTGPCDEYPYSLTLATPSRAYCSFLRGRRSSSAQGWLTEHTEDSTTICLMYTAELATKNRDENISMVDMQHGTAQHKCTCINHFSS